MEANFLILKFKILLLLLCLTNAFSIEVLIANKKINYHAKILKSDLHVSEVFKLTKRCIPLKYEDLKNNKYIAKHFINKNSVLCLSSVTSFKKNAIIFNFGNIQIEENGKVVFENEKYITIKQNNGKLKKIYKNGINK